MAKRKRQTAQNGGDDNNNNVEAAAIKKQKPVEEPKTSSKDKPIGNEKSTINDKTTASPSTIQVVVGFYDGVLHGLTATIASPQDKKKKKKNTTEKTTGKQGEVEFADTFLLTAHTKSIRCLALSPVSALVPGQIQKRILASGSADSKVNLYELSAHPPPRVSEEGAEDPLRHAAPRPILENRRNRELGSLEHHASAVTALQFPVRSKLMSASEDSTVAVTRTRDWALLSTLRVPVAKAEGRPSGDTAPFDGTPQGVNDFTVHSSMKLMLTASKGERKIRPWNLTTGKRAKALSYGADLLQQVGESKHASGEAKKLACGSVDGEDEFAVGFDRDVVVFNMAEGEPKCTVLGDKKTKVHQVRYLWSDAEDKPTLLAVSTEDGRVVLASTKTEHLKAQEGLAVHAVARTVAQVGGREEGVVGRIKDFALVDGDEGKLYVVGGGSDGVVRIWELSVEGLRGGEGVVKGRLMGSYRTDNRVTCLEAYMMTPNPAGDDEDADEDLDEEEEEDASSDEDDEEEEEDN